VVDVIQIDTALCLNCAGLDNVILNDTYTFVDSVFLIDVIETDIRHCLSSVGFPSVILNDTSTPVSVSDRWHHPPDSGITLQCPIWCPTLVFKISSVVDAMLDRLTDTIDHFCLSLKALNVVVVLSHSPTDHHRSR
jgi:hypothetical protein